MKKLYAILSLVLIAGVLLSCLMAFGVSASEPPAEAQLIITPKGGEATTESGTLDAMIQRLNASMSPAVATTYKLTLLTDATQNVAAVLSGNGNETITVSLDGHTLTSGTTSDLYSVNGVADFKLVGGFTREVELGKVVSGKISGALLAIPSSATAVAELSDIDIVYSGLNPDASVLDIGAGTVRLRNANITYTGEANALGASDALSLIKVGSASLTLSLSTVTDASKSGIVSAVSMNAATLRTERGEINADYAFTLSGGSHATIIDTAIVSTMAVFTAPDDETDNVVHTGGVKIDAPHIISGGVGKEDVTLWYGSGSTYITGVDDPAGEITLANSMTTLKALGNAYTLAHSYTSTAILTTMPDGGTPTEATNEFDVTSFNNASPSVPTAYLLAFLKDFTYTGKSTAITTGNENVTVFMDYNGKNILYTNSTGNNSNLMSASGSYKIMIDGADAEGKHAVVTSDRTKAALLYDTDGTEDAVFAFSGCDVVYLSDIEGAPMFHLRGGFYYFYDNKFTYTGELAGAPSSAVAITMLRARETSKVYVYDSEFCDTSTVENISTTALALHDDSTGYFRARNLKMVNVTKAADTSSTTLGADFYLADCDITTTATPYYADKTKAPMYVSDTITRITDSTVTNVAEGYVYFLVGDGDTRVITASGAISGGKFEKEGYGFFLTGDQSAFTVAYNNISLSEIFTDDMVLQAGKKTYIYGSSTEDGVTVKVSIGGIAETTATVANGEWCATFENLPYANGVTVTVREDAVGASDIMLRNVDIGEIWVMSGQSNSVYDVTKMDDFEEYLAFADDYDIKAYIMPSSSSMVENTESEARWHTIDKAWLTKQAGASTSSKNSVGLSAVAYVMATRLATELPTGVTVAIIDANYNGSTVEAWIDYDVAVDYAPDSAAVYKAYLDQYIANGNNYPAEEEMTDKNVGTYIPSNKLYSKMTTACYNAMIKPMEGFSVAGTIWYQGEGNGSKVTATTDNGYTACWRGVRQTFRNTFGNDQSLPMFVIQIPPYFSNLEHFRAVQYDMVSDDDNCYVVSNYTTGPIFSTSDFVSSNMGDSMVHYARKAPMGISLAASILENHYHMGQLSAPKVDKVEADADKIKITLDRDVEIMWGEEIVGFEIAGSDGEFKTAHATVDGRTITLTADGVQVATSVRYGYGKAQFEMKDGNLITLDENVYNFTCTKTTETNINGKNIWDVVITKKSTGEVLYSFSSEEMPVIRCRGTGNVVSTTGQTLPCFKIDVK